LRFWSPIKKNGKSDPSCLGKYALLTPNIREICFLTPYLYKKLRLWPLFWDTWRVLNNFGTCNTPRFSSRCFIRWLVLCTFRPRGMLVIARRGFLSGFGPKTFIGNYSFSLLSKDRNLSSLPHTLKLSSLLLSSSFNPPKLVLDCFACLKLWMSLKIASQHPSSSMLSHHCRVV